MRFLAPAWGRGDLTDAEHEAAGAAWREHHDALLPRLPADVRRFALRLRKDLTIHDSFVRRANVDLARRRVEVVLRCFVPPQFDGQVDLTLRFGGVEALRPHDEEFARFLALPDVEWLYDEIDLAADGAVEFRILHWRPEGGHAEHGLRFRRLHFRVRPVAASAWLRAGDEAPVVRVSGRVAD